MAAAVRVVPVSDYRTLYERHIAKQREILRRQSTEEELAEARAILATYDAKRLGLVNDDLFDDGPEAA